MCNFLGCLTKPPSNNICTFSDNIWYGIALCFDYFSEFWMGLLTMNYPPLSSLNADTPIWIFYISPCCHNLFFWHEKMSGILVASNVYLYYKSWKNWNPFSSRLDPSYLSRRPHSPAWKVRQNRMNFHFLVEEKYFHPKDNFFFTNGWKVTNRRSDTHRTRIRVNGVLGKN